MIRTLSAKDKPDIFRIINQAAEVYRGHIPDDCYHEPYMAVEELEQEMVGMTFFGWQEGDKLVGVMGLQPVTDVTLIRHAYILPGYQRSGIGKKLMKHLLSVTTTGRLLVGTWADATWAVDFYLKQGFKLMPNKDELLRQYWDIPQRQIDTSVVFSLHVHLA